MNERDIFIEALQKADAAERQAYLDEACGRDAALRRQVEDLLKVSENAGSFLESLPPGMGATITPAAVSVPGTVIGPYKLLQQLGEGGMGTVFMAEQTQPVQRKVALKIIKPGMDSRQVIARFEAERQALALMDHPNIAKVLDAGTTGGRSQGSGVRDQESADAFLTPGEGRPYFVMELVKGVPINRFCDERRLTPRQRLELFLPVCQAVQHAHQKGIIHRDLKPNNVLVALYDDKPVPKVIDFGVAKATGQKLTDRTMFTEFGQIVGTLEYMSPEQAGLNQLDIDTRSDIYSLGVLLYELLTGTTPLQSKRLRDGALLELLRLVREEEPPKPSTRLSTTEELPSVAANRSLEPKKLSGLVCGELDWVVMKCLEKDRNRRYETASALAVDIQRYLADEPVQACPPSALYRFRKFARRNKAALVTTALVSAALLLAVGGLVASNLRISRETEEKERALVDARRNEDAATAQRQQAEANLQLARKAVDDLYSQLADKFTDLPRMQALQREFLHKVLNFYQEFARQKSTDPNIRLGIGRTHLRIGRIHNGFNEYGQAEAAYLLAIAELKKLAAEDPLHPEYRAELAAAYIGLGLLPVTIIGQPRAAQAQRAALEVLTGLAKEFPGQPDYKKSLATAHNALGRLLHAQPRQAEAQHHTAIALCEELVRLFPEKPWFLGELLRSHHCLGLIQAATGRHEEAAASFQKIIALSQGAADYLKGSYYRYLVPTAHLDLAKTFQAMDRPQKAEDSYRQAIGILEQYAADFPTRPVYWKSLFASYGNLAHLLVQRGRAEETAAIRQGALNLYVKVMAAGLEETGSEQVLETLPRFLTTVLKSPNQPEEMINYYRQAADHSALLADKFPARPDGRFLVASWHHGLGSLLAAAGRTKESEAAYREAVAQYRAARDLDLKHLPSLNNLAWLLATCPHTQLRDARCAVRLAQQATELGPQVGGTWNALGVAHYRAGDSKAAVMALEKSMALDAAGAEGAKGEGFCTFFLAMSHWHLGHHEEARQCYDRAVAGREKRQPADEELRRFQAEAAALLGR